MKRQVLFVFVILLIGALVSAPAARAGEPTTQLSDAVARVLKTVDDPEFKKESKTAERRSAVRKIAEQIFDFQETAKRALGPHWQQRSPQEREQFVQLFSDLLENAYLSKIDLYTGEKVNYASETIEGDQAVVKTRIMTRQGSEIPVDYRMHKLGDKWLAYDVIIEGVSLVSNYRAQFNKIIQTSSFEGLMDKMRTRSGVAAPPGAASASPTTKTPASK